MPATSLVGRSIVITGASSGIGWATAEACAAAGMRVAVAARRADRLAALVAIIRDRGGEAIAIPTDVADPHACRRLIDRTLEQFGALDAVFANAGYTIESPALELSDADWHAIFETNFFGTLYIVRPAVEAMRRARRGHVLICTSCLSKLGVPHYAAYTATKACQDHLGRALRHELAGSNILVSTVHPVGTRTELLDRARRDGIEPLRWSPPGTIQSAERVARAVVACLRRPRPELWTRGSMRWMLAAAVALPSLADSVLAFALRRALRRRQRSHASATPP